MKQSSNNNLAENKVLILYLLSKINSGITNDALFNIVSSVNNVNYFYFKQYLTDLINSNLVGTYSKDNDTILKITSEGKNAFSLTKDLLPGIVRLKADNIFKKELSMFAEESSVVSEFIPKNEKDYTVKCKIIENNETIFEVSTFAGSRDRAKKIADNWKENANSIYPEILKLLLQEDKNN